MPKRMPDSGFCR